MTNQVVPMTRPSLLMQMASAYSMDADKFAATIRSTCMPSKSSNEDFAAFLMVAHKHGLNPVTREIYAFPKKGGGIQPIVGVDGWMTLINNHPEFDGIDFEDAFNDKGELVAITCKLYRKDRSRPVSVTEYMAECKRPTEPWQKWPARMLRHKAAIQAARYAFSFSGIVDPEEAERSPEVITESRVQAPPPAPAPHTETEATDEPDNSEFLYRLGEALKAADTPEGLAGAWEEYDVEATLTQAPSDLEAADTIYAEQQSRVEQIEGA